MANNTNEIWYGPRIFKFLISLIYTTHILKTTNFFDCNFSSE